MQKSGVREAVRARFLSAGFEETPRLSVGQSEILEGSIALSNERGTAPGIFFEHDAGIVVLLPGPPGELRSVVSGPLRAELRRLHAGGRPVTHRVIHTT